MRVGVRFSPLQPWVDIRPDTLAWHDRSRREWVGHNVKLGESYFIVDRVEIMSDDCWRLYLIEPE